MNPFLAQRANRLAAQAQMEELHADALLYDAHITAENMDVETCDECGDEVEEGDTVCAVCNAMTSDELAQQASTLMTMAASRREEPSASGYGMVQVLDLSVEAEPATDDIRNALQLLSNARADYGTTLAYGEIEAAMARLQVALVKMEVAK